MYNKYLGKYAELTRDACELEPRYDSAQSFYGKALVIRDGSTDYLYSYLTPVACYSDKDGLTLFSEWECSATTLRHVKEFAQQHSFEFIGWTVKDYRRALEDMRIGFVG